LAAEAEQKAGKANLPGAKPKKPTELSDKERFDRRLVKDDATEQHPENRARTQRLLRRSYQEEYGDLYAELNLSPENLEKFKHLLVDKHMTYSDAAALVATQGISSFSGTGRKAVEQAQDKVEQDIRALLGEEAYKAYQEHNRLRRSMARMQSFQAALEEKGAQTLDKVQLRALVTACCDVTDKERNPDYTTIANDPGGTVATKQILQRTSAALTPQQVQAFFAYREEADAAEKASEAFVRGEAPLPTL
jgi:hypothetical protein